MIAGIQSRPSVTRDSDTEMLGSAGRMASADNRHTANPIRRTDGKFGEKWAGEGAGSFTLLIIFGNQNILTQKWKERGKGESRLGVRSPFSVIFGCRTNEHRTGGYN